MPLCQVGPAVVRLLDTRSAVESGTVSGQLADAVLGAGDGELVLLGERAVPAARLWSEIFENLLADHRSARLLLVHPSWWPSARVERVAAPARVLVQSVCTAPRSEMHSGAAVFVEVGPQFVAVGGAARQLAVHDRDSSVGDLLDWVCRQVGAGAAVISLDSPPEVAGGTAFRAALVRRLRDEGRTVLEPGERRLLALLPPEEPADRQDPETPRPRRRAVLAAVVAALAVAALILGVVSVLPYRRTTEISSTAAELVEGSLAVQVPADWPARRVTDGPGSDRVRVDSPRDPEAALHITQSLVPHGDLAATASALATAIAAQPPGVFVDLERNGRRAGRPAVRYREVRASHDIDWSVLVDGDLQISIGCQSVPGSQVTVEAACEQAIRSAHRIR